MTSQIMKISKSDSIKNSYHMLALSFADFVEDLKKFHQLPFTYEEYNKFDNNTQSNIKDIGNFVFGELDKGKRSNGTVVSRTGFSFDYDQINVDQMKKIRSRMKNGSLNYVIYSTASYRDDKPSFRLLIPFNKPLTELSQFKELAKAFIKSCDLPEPDSASYTLSQCMHLPTHLKDVEPIFEYKTDGEYLDVDSLKTAIKTPLNNNEQSSNKQIQRPPVVPIDDNTAIDMVEDYVQHEGDNLNNYNNFQCAMFSIIQGYQENIITEDLAVYLMQVLAGDNEDWKVNNVEKFYQNIDVDVRTEYGFIERFGFYSKNKQNLPVSANPSTYGLSQYDIASILLNDIDFLHYAERYYFINPKTQKFISDDQELKSIVFNYCGNVKTYYIDEVIKQLKYRCRIVPVETVFKIKFNNGYLENGEFIFEDTNEFTPYHMNLEYNPNAQPVQIVDDYINHLTNSNAEYRKLLMETLGHIFVVDPEFKRLLSKFFIFVGGGGNGKGTLLQIIKGILGYHNVSGMDIKQLSDDRYLPSLKGKLANLGDDIQDQAINDRDMKILKNITTCDYFNTRELYESSVSMYFTATLIFTSNHLIKSFEKGKSYKRRVMWLPMYTEVKEKNKDPLFITKLTSKESVQYWIRLIIEGYKRLYKQKTFTSSDLVNQFNDDYHKENNPYILYLEDYTEKDLLGVPIRDVYNHCATWCMDNNVNFSEKMLRETILEKFNLNTHGVKRDKDTGKPAKVFDYPKEHQSG